VCLVEANSKVDDEQCCRRETGRYKQNEEQTEALNRKKAQRPSDQYGVVFGGARIYRRSTHKKKERKSQGNQTTKRVYEAKVATAAKTGSSRERTGMRIYMYV
jgi:hypothetical protein